jgi:hypothetical protein
MLPSAAQLSTARSSITMSRSPNHKDSTYTLNLASDYCIADLFIRQIQQEGTATNPELGFFAQELDEQRTAKKQRQDKCLYIAIALLTGIGTTFWAVALMYAMGRL